MGKSLEYERFFLKEYTHWVLFLHQNQCYLGRIYLLAKRHNALDFFLMTEEEKSELFLLGKVVTKALSNLFQPDIFNVASLGNIFNHLHVHIIPRYKESRYFEGMQFTDNRWGKNYSPYDYNFKTPDHILKNIHQALLNVML